MAPPDPQAAALHVAQGDAHYLRGDLVRALAAYSEAIRHCPTAAACAGRARVLIQRREFARAIADCDAALGLDPADADVYITRAVAFFETGEIDRAIADNTEALRLDPT